MKKDISGKEDIKVVMSAFYAKATKDAVIGVKFNHINMQEHIPKIVEFWSTIIFYEGDYKGSPFDKHLPLHLKKQDFDRWLLLFEETVRAHHEGEMTEEIINRAKNIGRIFLFKIESLQPLD
jgi:hemoglobin